MRLYGYKLIDVPIIDSADLFLVKAGDQIINSLFTFDRQDKQLALRPEFTASAADYFARTQGNPVARWQFAGPVFEDKSNELISEFEQLGIGAELIGLGGSLAEAEIIAMSASGLDKIGIQNTHITIGHMGLIREIVQQFRLDVRTQRFLMHHIPAFNDPDKGAAWILDQFDQQFSIIRNNPTRIDESYAHDNLGSNLSMSPSGSPLTMGGRTQEDILQRMKLKQQRFTDRDNVVGAVEHLVKWCQISGEPHSTFAHLSELVVGNEMAAQLLQEWCDVISLLEAHGITLSTITIKPDLARSWEYYTGIVFELHSNDKHLGGGGRYDELARLIGSKVDTPSVGFAYYGNRLMDVLLNVPYEFEPIATITSDEKDMISATRWANKIRNHGISVQILPRSVQGTARELEINMENATTVQFKKTRYQLEQIDLLINDLKQSYK
jgi:histidyl-tRNA synthetase